MHPRFVHLDLDAAVPIDTAWLEEHLSLHRDCWQFDGFLDLDLEPHLSEDVKRLEDAFRRLNITRCAVQDDCVNDVFVCDAVHDELLNVPRNG